MGRARGSTSSDEDTMGRAGGGGTAAGVDRGGEEAEGVGEEEEVGCVEEEAVGD